jgi:hypothetical protein
MGIIYSDTESQNKTHCDLCGDRLTFPCWGYAFEHINSEKEKGAEVCYLTSFLLALCWPCASETARNIVFDMRKTADDCRNTAELIDSIPIRNPESVVKTQLIKNN